MPSLHESCPVDTSQLSMTTSVMLSEFVTSDRITTQIKPTAPLKAALEGGGIMVRLIKPAGIQSDQRAFI